MSLAAAVVSFIEARAAIQAACPEARKFAVVHGGKGYFFNVDPVQGVGVAVSDALAMDGTAPADAPTAEKKPRAKKAEAPLAGPGSVEGAVSPTAPAADTAAPAWTKDKYRAHARDIASVIGIEAVKAIHGQRAIDTIPAEEYAALAVKLDAAKKEAGQL